jgi:S1-C subfamily serine protease
VLGIAVQDVSGQLGAYLKVPDGQGVLVTEVQAGSAAEKGGLHAGDVITTVDGQRVRNTNELRARVRSTQETHTAALKVIRNGVETTVNVEVSPAPQSGSRRGRQPAIPI